ncbi:MAG: HNH endonuclease, partial [Pseudonocardiaceae bacterium]
MVADKATATGAPAWGRRRVLLLNATFEPLTALPLRRAIVLVVCGKADVVHGDTAGLVLHSAATSIVVPSVIKLRTFV